MSPCFSCRRLVFVVLAVAAVQIARSSATASPQPAALGAALTFHASFDQKIDAQFAAGDPRLYWAPNLKERQRALAGLPDSGAVQLAPDTGRFGGALRFTARKSPVVFYRGERNMPYAPADWNGTVSFWLSTDPEGALEPGFCDPVQITPRAWNDAAFFVEFEKRPESIPFRLGVYADLPVWNPQKRPIAEIPASERPLVGVDRPPFARGKWTHVAFTFENFNTKKPDGIARLYLDGAAAGMLSAREQTFTWDAATTVIALGLNYIGLLDEMSIFNRALTAEEVRAVYALDNGIASLRR